MSGVETVKANLRSVERITQVITIVVINGQYYTLIEGEKFCPRLSFGEMIEQLTKDFPEPKGYIYEDEETYVEDTQRRNQLYDQRGM